MNVLVTGVNGLLGQKVSKALLAVGSNVYGIDVQPHATVDGIEYMQGDLTDSSIDIPYLSDVDVVIHLAAITEHDAIMDNPFRALQVSVVGTSTILAAFQKLTKQPRLIFASTGKVYGDIQELPITEEHPLLPKNVLGRIKLQTEQIINFHALTNDQSTNVILRIFNVFGEGQRSHFLLPTILNQIDKTSNSSTITLGDVHAKRDYLYVDDVANAFVRAAQASLNPGLHVLNICSGKGLSANDIVDSIADIMGKEIHVLVDKNRLRADEDDVEYGSSAKAKKSLMWEPGHSLKEGLSKTIQAYI